MYKAITEMYSSNCESYIFKIRVNVEFLTFFYSILIFTKYTLVNICLEIFIRILITTVNVS